jgi:predicted DNA-binding protein with PD1-like motif
MTLSRDDGSVVAGHLDTATTFAGELYVREFDTELERAHDDVTDLDLWPL